MVVKAKKKMGNGLIHTAIDPELERVRNLIRDRELARLKSLGVSKVKVFRVNADRAIAKMVHQHLYRENLFERGLPVNLPKEKQSLNTKKYKKMFEL